MEPGEGYLRGELSLGVLGKVKLFVFPNENKKEDKHPDYNICVPKGDGEKGVTKVGVFWKSKKREPERAEPHNDILD